MNEKLARNDRCPCGSGKKYKKCCGSPASTGVGSTVAFAAMPPRTTLDALLDLVHAGRFADVEKRAQEFLRDHPGSVDAWKILGLALWKQKKNALVAMEQAVHLAPRDAEAHVNLGNVLRAAGRCEEAAQCQRRAIEIKPDYAEAHNNLGSVLRDVGSLEAALASYRRAAELRPDFALVHANLGHVLRGLGRPSEAVDHYRRALALEPLVAQTHNNLGNVLQDLGEFAAAITHHRRALEINPEFAPAHDHLGNAQRALGLYAQAEASHRRALAIDPHYAEAYSNLGNALLDNGKPEEAVAAYQQSLGLQPRSVAALLNLGSALRELGLTDAAETSFRTALELAPDSAAVHVGLAVVQRLQNRHREAEVSCARALALDPRSVAAMILQAKLAADAGRFDTAEGWYRQAMTIESHCAEAWSGIVGLRKMTTGDADWLTVAERAATSGLPARKEAHLRFAMGKYFDDIEDFGRAMECFRRANELTRSLRPRHDRERLSRFVDRIIDVCDGQWMALHRRHTMPDSARAAFIVGMPRSGTTLAEHILASHPAVFGAGELPFWGRHSAQFDLSGHAGTGIAALAHAYLELLAGLSADARRVVDKMPDNFLSLGLIHAALPEARILHMRRNPLDTCLSIYFQDFEAGYTYANDLEDLSHYYRQYERVMNHWRSVLPPGVILDVSYEELVDQPEASSRRMIDFIGLPWDAQCLEFQRTRRTVTTVSQWRVRQKIDRSSIERWRHYEPFIAPLMGLQTGDVGSAAA